MTSLGSYNDDKKLSMKVTDENAKKNGNFMNVQIPKVGGNYDKIANNDNSLPWTSPKEIKNGKNFYENYSKENDKRKKEGIISSIISFSFVHMMNNLFLKAMDS